MQLGLSLCGLCALRALLGLRGEERFFGVLLSLCDGGCVFRLALDLAEGGNVVCAERLVEVHLTRELAQLRVCRAGLPVTQYLFTSDRAAMAFSVCKNVCCFLFSLDLLGRP